MRLKLYGKRTGLRQCRAFGPTAKAFSPRLLKYGTKYVTMYSLENTQALNEAAKEVGIKQKVLLKVVGNGDDIYPGQTGGFTFSGTRQAA